jgi:hypothetical protein
MLNKNCGAHYTNVSYTLLIYECVCVCMRHNPSKSKAIPLHAMEALQWEKV